jgi:hypothetical protein
MVLNGTFSGKSGVSKMVLHSSNQKFLGIGMSGTTNPVLKFIFAYLTIRLLN